MKILQYLTTPDIVYSYILAILYLISLLYHLIRYIRSSLYPLVRPYILRHVIYARFYYRFLRLRSISRSHFILTILYITGTVICNFIQIDSVQAGGKRAAKLSLINLIPLFLGGGYELGARLLGITLSSYGFIHRLFASIALLEAIAHIVIITQSGSITWSNKIEFNGLLTACMFLALTILPFIKKRVYELFLLTHFGCAITIIYTVWQHTQSAEENLWVFSLIYVCIFILSETLQVLRIIYRNIVIGKGVVRLNLEPYVGDVARITLLLPRPWAVQAGQRVSLGVPFVGLFYLFQSHPFTISWWENDTNGRAVSISILLRPQSGFTRRILKRLDPNIEYSAWIDGPFGPASINSNDTIGEYGCIFMIATGIGIASQLPYIKELLDGHEKAEVRTQRISLVWQLERVGDWESARDLLQMLVRQDNGLMLRVLVYDPLHSQSGNEVQQIGDNGLINVHSGHVDWKDQINLKIRDRIGRLLVTVAAQLEVRHEVRNLIRVQVDNGVDLFEPEFQPWGQTGSLRSFLKP